ncbi:hypothetical protein [Niallia endozanthoxylica]|uniref:Uncharacterized protein n=1 Tax=Niallia endozanthoxylica TaxID=2036016 RepID=A0A5J5HPJ7_9BACI|nr:hypothetical protein [Niallia endozanthoxylica]KAA9022610.1 hypothetical protein F4V44_15170 [Niallia endozanthoxylica]
MEHIKMEDLQPFISQKVMVAILDKDGEEQAPFVPKEIQKLELCPDHTHLRIYFDRRHFFAIPLTASVSLAENAWTAFDQQSQLYYVIKKRA